MSHLSSLRCLFLHNYYQHAGGEDLSMSSEISILRRGGHTVELLKWHNDSIEDLSKIKKIALSWETTWNTSSSKRVTQALRDFNSDLLHVQNFFPIASPSVYSAAHRLNIPVIQHLRNFRLGCLNSYLYRKGKVCEDCLGRNPWRGVVRRCYRKSLPASASVWHMLTFHRFRKTWNHDVEAFITPSQFAATKLVEIGVPANKLYVKPNFIEDPLSDSLIPASPEIPTFLFVGRLSDEKGVMLLLKAWKLLNKRDWKLVIAGSGPELDTLKSFSKEHELTNVEFTGRVQPQQLVKMVQSSTALLVPSQWYETFGRVVIEAFACGRPVIASNIGALAELVQDNVNGFLIEPGSESAWTESIRWCGNNQLSVGQMGLTARALYLKKFTPQKNYQQMIDIYRRVLNA